MGEDGRAMPLAQVVGQNAKQVRDDAGATLDDVAKAAKRLGLTNWGTGRVSDLEHGKVSPTLPTLVALCLALGETRGKPLTLGELVEHSGSIRITNNFEVSSATLQRYLSGGAVVAPKGAVPEVDWEAFADETIRRAVAIGLLPGATLLEDVDAKVLASVERRSGEAEAKIARSLGVERSVVDLASAALWRQTFSAERDRRAGEGANAQKRGRIARELKAELKAVLDGDD
jgi:transcriptional regulator with XRE-family HTH domain